MASSTLRRHPIMLPPTAQQSVSCRPQKKTLLKQLLDEKQSGKKHSLLERLDSFLLSYRNTPNSTTGRTPAELFLKRQPRVKLSLLKPDFVKAMQNKQQHLNRVMRREVLTGLLLWGILCWSKRCEASKCHGKKVW